MSDVWARLAEVFRPAVGRDARGVTSVTGVTTTVAVPQNSTGYVGYAGYATEAGSAGVMVGTQPPSPLAAGHLPSVQDFAERAALVQYGANVPRGWAEGFARLDLTQRPARFRDEEWRRIVDDAGRFLDQWGAEAARLGWSALDVFGVHRIAPEARVDVAGLVLLINGGEVTSVATDMATIRAKGTGSTLNYRRSTGSGGVTLWEVVSGR